MAKPVNRCYLVSRIGTALRERRKLRGLTLLEASALAGISLGYLSQVERGENSVSITLLVRMARAVGAKASEIVVEAEAAEEMETLGSSQL